jgi:hypothetical protein
VLALLVALPVGAQECTFPESAPDPAEFQFMVGNVVQIQQADGRWMDATVRQVIPWWDTNICGWRVNYRAEIVQGLTFTEGDLAVRIKPMPRSAAPTERGLK